MATITDHLTTILKITGGQEYARGMKQAAGSVDKLAKAEDKLDKAQRKKKQNLGTIQSAFTNLTAGFLSYQTAVGFVTSALDEFTASQERAFRAGFAFKGTAGLFEQMTKFSQAQAAATGLNSDAIRAQAQLLHFHGLNEQQIKSLIPATLDLARATGIELEDATRAVARGLAGESKELRKLGVEYRATGDRAKDLMALQKAINREFGGAAAGFRGTAAGARGALGEAFRENMGLAGGGINRTLQPLMEAATAFLRVGVSDKNATPGTREALRRAMDPNPFKFFSHLRKPNLEAAGQEFEAQQKAQLGAGRGGNAKTRTEALLEEIAKNTDRAADPLIRGVLGGSGNIARGAATHRDAIIAFGL